jgi:hypothetical protein
MSLTIYQLQAVSPSEFVAYWCKLYPVHEDVELYTPNIGLRLPEALHKLFLWKFGKRFAAKTKQSVDANVISRLAELNELSENLSARDFLDRFPTGGAIFRIFLLHCWNPKRFPIYDQHVHRAMSVAEKGLCEEIEIWPNAKKVDAYIDQYLPFYGTFVGLDSRSIDQALWAFGKFIKSSQLPGGCRRRHRPSVHDAPRPGKHS